ncbi:hypothetical protein C1645_763908 [Glomus cerebriforme]|uniref:Uncharacterized protein n=1 Tax=Glomus cerebriforme TaxID=658196 RepID=A0A397T954_9GLOM|nr:hypothetical protein C1645_763908 [Glomus cerebriforme]
MAGILEKPNRVIEYQKFFQTNTSTPLWIRGGFARRSFMYLFFGSLSVGFVGSAYTLTQMIRGKK